MLRCLLLAAALFLPDLETIAQTPRVAAVYPSGPSISNHTLRISIRFTAAVWAEVLGHLHLLNEHGIEIQRAFLAKELWSPDRRELTVLFDPARLKVGVGKHDTLGLPLGATSHVQLLLDAIPIKSWAVSSSPCLGITPNQWAHVMPRGGTRDALQITFPEPADHISSQLIAIVDSTGRRVEGQSLLIQHEQQWVFTPTRPWVAGRFRVLLNPAFETPCGDRYQSLFEQTSSAPAALRNAAIEILAFSIRHPKQAGVR